MAPLFKSLLGNGSRDRELTEEMRAVLDQMRQERDRFAALIEKANASATRLSTLGEPIADAEQGVTSVRERLDEMKERFEAMVRLASMFEGLDERATGLTQSQKWAEERIVQVLDDSQKIRDTMEELVRKVDLAAVLRDQLDSFLQVDQPFQQMRGEAETIRGQIDGTHERMARLREQHDRLLDAHKLAVTKMEALDRRRDELGRSLQDKERRVESVAQAVQSVDGVQHTIDALKRDMATLKALGDAVAQKTAALEAQRDAVDRALGQAELLDRAMRQVDLGIRQQQENEKALGALQEQVDSLRSLHESVISRSSEITKLQRDTDEQSRTMRVDLAATATQMEKTIERFEFETRGLESVSQRVADLRGELNNVESRFKGLAEASRSMGELQAQGTALGGQMQSLSAEVGRVEQDLTQLRALRRELDETGRTTRELGVKVTQLVEARPAIERAHHDLEDLAGAHARVKDALEQSNVAHGEIARMRAAQAEARTWMQGVEQSVAELRQQSEALQALAPSVQHALRESERVNQATTVIEARREFVDDLHRRASELGALAARVDERSQQLQTRMEAAEMRFTALGEQADEAERIRQTIESVSAHVDEAVKRTTKVRAAVEAIEERSASIEALADATQTLKDEIDQRQGALQSAGEDLRKASTLREQAAAAAQKLDQLAQKLGAALTTAEQRAAQVGQASSALEQRTETLTSVEERLARFEARMSKWDHMEEQIAQSLAQIDARQGTVESLKADLDRMLAMAEATSTHVREITSAQRELEDSRQLLAEVQSGLQEVRDTASSLDDRRRQTEKAEERLARAEALLVDIRTSIEALEGQKVMVDQAVEKAGSLQSLLRQAESSIEALREERQTTARVRSAVKKVRRNEDEGGDLPMAA